MEVFFLLILVILMATALASGYPVAFALPGSSVITILLAAGSGYLFTGDASSYFFQGDASQWLSAGVTNLRGIYWEPERDTLIAIPLFIFMGIMLQRSKIAEDLLITMANLFGPVPGGLGIAVIFVGALLAATTGIVGATVVAMGMISLPCMMRNNYSQSLATGTIAASGTLGQIIPPSIVLIILSDQLASAADQASGLRKALYKSTTGEISMPSSFDVVSTSAGEMFLGALIPGLVLVGLYMVYVLVAAWLKPSIAPPVLYEGEFDRAFFVNFFITLVPPLSLIFLVLGSIMGGIATVNQAGAIGAAGALIMSSYRLKEGDKDSYWPAILSIGSMVLILIIVSNFNTNIKNIKTSSDMLGVSLAVLASFGLIVGLVWSGWRAFKIENTLEGVMMETAKATALVFIILLGAAILTAAFRAFGGEHLIREFLEGLPGGFWLKFIIVMGVIFLLGFFLDFIEIAVVVVPIVAPILLADPGANVTAVWLGVMIGLNIQTSFLTPPFGFALFYLRGVAPAVIKTINMYKGVIPYILLQLLALVIVSNLPALVNYLPNRVALLSENSPPPRNPKLNYCVGRFVSEEIVKRKDAILASVGIAKQIDLSSLPHELAKNIQVSFDKVEEAFKLRKLLDQHFLTLENASDEFAPLHFDVRSIERSIVRINNEIEEYQENNKEKFELLEQKIELEKQIPTEWNAKLKAYRNLQKTYKEADRLYHVTATEAYKPVAEVMAILEANKPFSDLKSELFGMKERVDVIDPKEMLSPLKVLSIAFRNIQGAENISTAISKARRALKGRVANQKKAQSYLDKAILEYEDQMVWRDPSEKKVLLKLATYEDQLRGTIGIRSQAKFSKKQALKVAACQSQHRDISLNF